MEDSDEERLWAAYADLLEEDRDAFVAGDATHLAVVGGELRRLEGRDPTEEEDEADTHLFTVLSFLEDELVGTDVSRVYPRTFHRVETALQGLRSRFIDGQTRWSKVFHRLRYSTTISTADRVLEALHILRQDLEVGEWQDLIHAIERFRNSDFCQEAQEKVRTLRAGEKLLMRLRRDIVESLPQDTPADVLFAVEVVVGKLLRWYRELDRLKGLVGTSLIEPLTDFDPNDVDIFVIVKLAADYQNKLEDFINKTGREKLLEGPHLRQDESYHQVLDALKPRNFWETWPEAERLKHRLNSLVAEEQEALDSARADLAAINFALNHFVNHVALCEVQDKPRQPVDDHSLDSSEEVS